VIFLQLTQFSAREIHQISILEFFSASSFFFFIYFFFQISNATKKYYIPSNFPTISLSPDFIYSMKYIPYICPITLIFHLYNVLSDDKSRRKQFFQIFKFPVQICSIFFFFLLFFPQKNDLIQF